MCVIWLRSTLQANFLILQICIKTQKCSWSILSQLMYFFSNWEVYLKWTFNTDVFTFKLRSILEVDFLNLCIYVQIQKHAGSRFFKLMYFISKSEVYLWYVFILKLRNILEVNFLNLCIYLQTQKHT